MEKLRKLVEIGSNVAIILVALVLGYFLVGKLTNPPAKPGAASAETTIKPGTKLSVQNVDFAKSEKNLLLVLSTSCKYCTESIPFYQRLAESNAVEKKLNMVAAFSQEPPEAAKYLIEKNLSVDQIIKTEGSEIRVRGTPTLILTDKDGTVLESWSGKLPPEKEIEVMGRLFGENRASHGITP